MSKAQALARLDVAREWYAAVYAENYDARIAFRASGSDADMQAMIASKVAMNAAVDAIAEAESWALLMGAFDPEPDPEPEQFALAL